MELFADFRNLVRAFLLALLTASFGSLSPVVLYLTLRSPMIIGIPDIASSVQLSARFCMIVGALLFSPCGMYTTARLYVFFEVMT
jgi:hypothetical protein